MLRQVAKVVVRAGAHSEALVAAVTLPTLNHSVRQFASRKMKKKKTNLWPEERYQGTSGNSYVALDEDYVEPKPGVIENTLVNCALVMERPPICYSDPLEWEVAYRKFEHARNQRTSIEMPKDLIHGIYSKLQDPEREAKAPAYPKITQDDLANDRRSLYRQLEQPIYLIFKVKNDGSKSHLPNEYWTFPQTEWRDSETVRSAAERTFFYHAGERVRYYVLGNAPIFHTESKPSKEEKKAFPQVTKVKSFFMHALYLAGPIDLEPDSDVVDYAWVTKKELGEYFTTTETKPLLSLADRSLYYGNDAPDDYDVIYSPDITKAPLLKNNEAQIDKLV